MSDINIGDIVFVNSTAINQLYVVCDEICSNLKIQYCVADIRDVNRVVGIVIVRQRVRPHNVAGVLKVILINSQTWGINTEFYTSGLITKAGNYSNTIKDNISLSDWII